MEVSRNVMMMVDVVADRMVCRGPFAMEREGFNVLEGAIVALYCEGSVGWRRLP